MLHSMLELMEKMDVGSIAKREFDGETREDGQGWTKSHHFSFEQRPKPWLFALYKGLYYPVI